MKTEELQKLMDGGGKLADLLCHIGSDVTLQELRDLLDPEMAARKAAIKQELGAVTPQMAMILQAMGTASVCWKEGALMRAGEFDSRLAAEVADTLYKKLGLTG